MKTITQSYTEVSQSYTEIFSLLCVPLCNLSVLCVKKINKVYTELHRGYTEDHREKKTLCKKNK